MAINQLEQNAQSLIWRNPNTSAEIEIAAPGDDLLQINGAGVRVALAIASTNPSTGSIITPGGIGIGGAVNIGADIVSTSKTTGSVVVTGGMGVSGDLYANRCFNPAFADLAEIFITSLISAPGEVICINKKTGELEVSSKRADPNIIGVFSDTYGFCLGGNQLKGIPICLTGRVRVKVNTEVSIGDLLVSAKDGFAQRATFFEKIFRRECIIGKVLENNSLEKERRVWIKV